MSFDTIDTIENVDDLAKGVEILCQREPAFARIYAATGLPPLRRKPGGLAGLLEIIAYQQISLTAAGAIWARMEAKLAPFEVKALSHLDDRAFMDCGLSRPKIATIRAVLAPINDGNLVLSDFKTAKNQKIFAKLTEIKGIGPWSAHIYLLTHLGRIDIWPCGDLALQESAKMLFGLQARPDEKKMLEMAEPWQPWRAVAARLLWSHYKLVKLDGGTL